MTTNACDDVLLALDRVQLAVGERTLLRSLSLSVRRGEIWGVLGANGVGKTLLFHTVLGVRAARGGRIHLCGRPLATWRALEAARIRSFLPQVLHDAFSMPAIDAVMAGRHPHLSRWAWGGEQDRAEALAALSAMGVAALADRDVMTLSGGERQRVAIAALIAQGAPLMLLDEPLAHLDLHQQIQVLEQLRTMALGATCGIMLSLHDINLASRFVTHVLLFHDDATADSGPVAEVLSEGNLSRAFGHRIARIATGDRSVFVAD